MGGTPHFAPAALEGWAAAVLAAQGLPPADARLVARGLVKANLRGVDSHGVARVPIYAERLRRGLVNPRPQMRLVPLATVAALLDGDGGMGFVVGERAMAEALALAKAHGLGLVAARRSTHFGMAALYVLAAVEAGCIGMVFTNASPALPVWGGRTPFLGTSPLAVGVPAGKAPPFILDMAMSVIARGKIRLAALRGEPIPDGVALDGAGRPTTDAAKAFDEGVCLPFGGAKGAGLAMLMDILGGVFTGAAFAGRVKHPYKDFSGPQDVGHLFLAIRADLVLPMTELAARMDELVARARACPRAVGFEEILIPGEPELRAERVRATTGIPVAPEVLAELEAEAARAGIAMPRASGA